MSSATSISDTVISVVGEVVLQTAEAAVVADLPFLGLPIIRQIWEFLVGKLEQKIVEQLQNGTAGIIINISDQTQAAGAKSAADQLQAVEEDEKSTADDIQKARDNFRKKYSALVGFNISSGSP